MTSPIVKTARNGKTYELASDWGQIFPHVVYLLIGGQRGRLIKMSDKRADVEALFNKLTA